nr:YciI family protein [uncultured Actinoplanes sp.]
MQYALLIYGDEKAWENRDERERAENMERHGKYMALLQSRKAYLGGEELTRSTAATTVRNQGESVGVTDGPYAETAEQLGGFYVIEAANLDEAIELAKALPEPIVEVRPVVPHPSM